MPEHDFIATDDDPCGVAVDSAHVYWTNWTLPGRIGRADIDGSDPDQDFIDNAGVNTQHVSVDDEHIFWSNKGFGDCDSDPANGCTIGRADLDGALTATRTFSSAAPTRNNQALRQTAPTSTGATGTTRSGARKTDGSEAAEPNFIPNVDACAVAVYGSHIYWADYGGSSGGHIGRANLDGTGVDEEYIDTAGGTCGVAVDGLTIAPPPPPPPPPPLPTECTSQTTLLVTCANLIGAPGVCVPGLELFPQCLHPTVPRTDCRRRQGRGGGP